MSIFQRRAIAAATFVLATSLAACSTGANSSGGDVVAVNGAKISRADFDRKLESSPTAKQVLQQLVQQKLIDQYAKDNNVQVSADEVTKKENETKAKYPAGQFEQIVKQQGLTQADLENIFRQQIVIERAVGSKAKVTDADIKAYFDKNHVQLDKPAQVRARHILVKDQKTADDVYAQLQKGAKFEDLAAKYSTDPSSKDKGGELGFFGRGQMVKPFEDAAFADPINGITKPVKSPFGYHVIQVEEKKPALKATLANTHDQIADTLKQQAQAQQIPAFLAELRNKAKIEALDSRYADAFPPPVPAGPATAASAAAAPSPAASK